MSNKKTMDDKDFINSFKKLFSDREKETIIETRIIISRASKIKVEFIHPNDVVLDLFGISSQIAGCAVELIQVMNDLSFIKKYKIDLDKVKNPDLEEQITVLDFINSVIDSMQES